MIYGSMAGMHSIGRYIVMAATALALAVRAEPVVLVQATASATNASERDYAKSLTVRLGRWLQNVAVPHAIVDDEAVMRGALNGVRVAILGYNPQPPPAERRAIRAFLDAGGKLIVFYSSEPELADMMGLRLDRYQNCPPGGRWSSIRFVQDAPPHLPAVVAQESRSIRLAYPVRAQARVIAYWADAKGVTSADPAWLLSDQGAWMTHVLLDDGDTENKERLLLGLTAMYEPSVWRPAAERRLRKAEQVGRYAGFAEAVAGLRREASGVAARRGAEAELAEAIRLREQAVQWHGAGRFAEVVDVSWSLRDALVRAYGWVQHPADGEMRGVWDHQGAGLYPGDWPRTCRLLAEHGITDIFPNMLWPGVADFESNVAAPSADFGLYGDQLKSCLQAAHALRMRVHVWKVCWRLSRADPALVAQMRNQGRLQVGLDGKTIDWLCPSNTENLRWEKDSLRDLLRRYPVDGVHLDYIRYQDSKVCYCPTCRRSFEAFVKKSSAPWPAAVRSGPLKDRFTAWRCNQITRLVRDTQAMVKAVDRDKRVSVAVFGKYPSCVDSVGQDWGAWLREGIVDFVCPMNYTDSLPRFNELLRAQLAMPGAAGRIYPGIGVTTSECRLDAVAVIDQIRCAREAGAPGYVFFELNGVLAAEILPVLSLGLTARR